MQRDIFVGVDSGTQSTKVVLVEGSSGDVIGSAAADHRLIEGLPPGHLEQHPQEWFDAMEAALLGSLRTAGVDGCEVRAIGVSGQQHGLIALDAEGQVIRPAKLWCDTSTATQGEKIVARVGGLSRFIELIGNSLPPGFTASKIAWLKECEPHNFARLHTVLLPHDFLNYRLTGQCRMECGDASGTALLDIRSRTWSTPVMAAIDAGLHDHLPPLIPSHEPCGHLQEALADRWGLSANVVIASGGGDNMMSAIGTGNVRDGVVTVSLGTSGTIFAYSSSPVVDPQGEVAAFCDSTGGWLPLVCTMNVTVATEQVKALFGLNNDGLEQAVNTIQPGSDGLLLIPYLIGERMPNVPSGTGVWFGANRTTHSPAHFARAAMEGATLGLNYGLQRLATLGAEPRQIRVTGGGSNSSAWRQIAADVFGVPVVCLSCGEAAALGAAIQAKWCHEVQRGAAIGLQDIVDQWVRLDASTRATPRESHVEHYRRMQELHNEVSVALRESFERHRRLITQQAALQEDSQ